uniref:Uncharacterized protein n=1 Tax=Trichuris muris TaxID=70415 RepID=A0A5S6QYV8_TRIMR
MSADLPIIQEKTQPGRNPRRRLNESKQQTICASDTRSASTLRLEDPFANRSRLIKLPHSNEQIFCRRRSSTTTITATHNRLQCSVCQLRGGGDHLLQKRTTRKLSRPSSLGRSPTVSGAPATTRRGGRRERSGPDARSNGAKPVHNAPRVRVSASDSVCPNANARLPLLGAHFPPPCLSPSSPLLALHGRTAERNPAPHMRSIKPAGRKRNLATRGDATFCRPKNWFPPPARAPPVYPPPP